jgi:hypothetical protein
MQTYGSDEIVRGRRMCLISPSGIDLVCEPPISVSVPRAVAEPCMRGRQIVFHASAAAE